MRGVRPAARSVMRLAWFAVLICTLHGIQILSAGNTSTFRDLKYQGVIPQTTDYTCGAAATACLLAIYYGIPTTEAEILEMAERQMLARGKEPGFARGLTAYDLKSASEALGLDMAGYELTHAQLEDYFERGGLPLIAHVTEPQSHYLVVVGMTAHHVLLDSCRPWRSPRPLREPKSSLP